MDMMGYLLSEDNYATTENVLLEAMAFALPIVAYKNKPEQYIIKDGVNGFLISDAEEYVERVKELKQSQELRKKMGVQARQSVIEQYSAERNRTIFLQSLSEVLRGEKKVRNFLEVYGETPYDWFLACTGKDRAFFSSYGQNDIKHSEKLEAFLQICNPIYKEVSKSSILHFASYFPTDPSLSLIHI